MKILALDPSLRNTACVLFNDGLLVSAHLITTKPGREKWQTAAEKDQQDIALWVNRLMAVIGETAPDLICAEQSIAGGQSAAAVRQLALVAGAMYTIEHLCPKPVWVYTRVHSAKYAALGKKNGSKEEIITAMVKRFPELDNYVKGRKKTNNGFSGVAEHFADACANYLACLELPSVKMMMQQEQKK